MRLLAFAVALVVATPAAASIEVAQSGSAVKVRVDARGNAEVSWIAGGARHTLLVPPTGKVLPGGKLPGADVSRPTHVALPNLLAVRRTSDGRLWAVQRSRGKLHFARWAGSPTAVTVAVDGTRLVGEATFQGKALPAVSPTPEGKRVRVTVFVDCFGCPGKRGWSRMLGVFPRPDGSFRVFLKPAWQGDRYRASVDGPNVGAILTPDAVATT
jgi:hypothetical protein